MAKGKGKSVTLKSVTLTAEEFQKLTPEEQVEYLNKLQSSNDELTSQVKSAKKEAQELPSFDVDEAGENYEAGEYQFTCPTFTWDDNRIINVHDLVAEAEGKDEKIAEKAQAIISSLVARQSGIVKRKED